jgi:hypothetical protein
MQDELTK